MKLLNDQGKILGFIAPLDLAVIIVIVLIGLKIIGNYRPIPLKQKERQVAFGVLLRDTSPYVAQSLAVGQDLFDDATDAYLGKIRIIRSKPAELLLPYQGEIRLAKSPRNLDIRLELSKQKGRIETGLARSGVYLGKIAARVGTPIRAHTRYTVVQGEIIFVKFTKP
jgi:hypothetical protein